VFSPKENEKGKDIFGAQRWPPRISDDMKSCSSDAKGWNLNGCFVCIIGLGFRAGSVVYFRLHDLEDICIARTKGGVLFYHSEMGWEFTKGNQSTPHNHCPCITSSNSLMMFVLEETGPGKLGRQFRFISITEQFELQSLPLDQVLDKQQLAQLVQEFTLSELKSLVGGAFHYETANSYFMSAMLSSGVQWPASFVYDR